MNEGDELADQVEYVLGSVCERRGNGYRDYSLPAEVMAFVPAVYSARTQIEYLRAEVERLKWQLAAAREALETCAKKFDASHAIGAIAREALAKMGMGATPETTGDAHGIPSPCALSPAPDKEAKP